MSYTNRKTEYERLVALGRQKDICPELMEEFGKVEEIKQPEPEKKKRIK